MRYQYTEAAVGGQLSLTVGDADFARYFFRERTQKLLAIVWNRGPAQTILIDETPYPFPENSFLCLNVSHSFRLDHPENTAVWQFNREFYCIVNHDYEVSCSGLLFYGWRESEPLLLDAAECRSFGLLLEVFQEEFASRDHIQGEMLRMLLKRLIIKLTRLAKTQYLHDALTETDLDTVRQFNLLVENNYKQLHQVQDYAGLMFKSPKTLSNLFARYQQKNPLQIISERIALESKRLLIYTDKPTSEIAYELGFDEPAHFSRFFKKMAGKSPSDFKKEVKTLSLGTQSAVA